MERKEQYDQQKINQCTNRNIKKKQVFFVILIKFMYSLKYYLK